jgi:hypothetical protein
VSVPVSDGPSLRRAVYYTINSAPFYLYAASKSVESLRRVNPKVDVHVFISLGWETGESAAAMFRGSGATVWLADKTKLGFPVDGYFERYFLKWIALEHLDYDSVLYADADTHFSQDPYLLFRELTEHDFYARVEMGAERTAGMTGGNILYSQIDHDALANAARALGARALPVFNTGIMLFNRSAHRKIASKLPRMFDVYQDLVSGRIKYPSNNPHIKEEIAAALVLGTLPDLSCGTLDREVAPWFFEYKSGAARTPGIVMHVLNEYFPFYQADFAGDSCLIPNYGNGTFIQKNLKRLAQARLDEAAGSPPSGEVRRFESAVAVRVPPPRAGAGPWEMAVRQIPRMLAPRANIFSGNFYWRGTESASGPGSDLAHTEAIRREIPALLKEHDIRSVLDAPCGDLHWMRHLQVELDRYVGIDLNPWLIFKHTLRNAASRPEFYCLDVTKDPLPTVDLILCRDLFIHLPYAHVLAALRNFKRSGSRYLLTTTYTAAEVNADIGVGGFYQINLRLPPFDFPPPLRLLDEGNEAAYGSEYAGKHLGLWKLSDIPA